MRKENIRRLMATDLKTSTAHSWKRLRNLDSPHYKTIHKKLCGFLLCWKW